MKAGTIDLKEFFSNIEVDPDRATAWCQTTCAQMMRAQKNGTWREAVAALRAEFDGMLRRGEPGCITAAHILFAIDALGVAGGPTGTAPTGSLVLGHLLQAAITQEEWARGIGLLSGATGAEADSMNTPPQPTLADFPHNCLLHLARRGDDPLLRELYGVVRGRIRLLCHASMRESTSHSVWVHGLAHTATALTERRLLPVVSGSVDTHAQTNSNADSGHRNWHPLAAHVLDADRLQEARRDEAYFEEQFAHLFAAIMSEHYLPERLARLSADVAAVVAAGDRLRAGKGWHRARARDEALVAGRHRMREELRRMRSRYEIPAYLFTELDVALRASTR